MESKFELPLSRKALVWLFAVLLPVFISIRWQPTVNLESILKDAARSNGVEISFSRLQLSGLNLQVDDVVIMPVGMPEAFRLGQVQLSPAWGELVTGNRAVDISALYAGLSGEATLILQEQTLKVESIRAHGDLSGLSGYFTLPMSIQLAGNIKMTGRAEIDLVEQMPVAAQFDVHWQDAIVRGLGNEINGGSYVAVISLQEPDVWRWQVDGGSSLSIKGEGVVQANTGPIQGWQCSGTSELLNQSDESLLSAILPRGKSASFTLSGTLGAPRFLPAGK